MHIVYVLVIASYRIQNPNGILEVGPAPISITVIDHDVGDRLYSLAPQRFQHRTVKYLFAVTVIRIPIPFGLVSAGGRKSCFGSIVALTLYRRSNH
jgi:hypothetical protein